jgi:hypothetical protein
MSEQATVSRPTSTTRQWSIDGFKSFWAKPDRSIVPVFHELATSDIVGYWPRAIGVVRGPASYVPVIDAVLRAVPDLKLTVLEYVRSEDLHFVRWRATGTRRGESFECNGLDRLRTTADGRVCENYVFCDHPFFDDVAAALRANARN